MFAIVELKDIGRFGARVTSSEFVGAKTLVCEIISPDESELASELAKPLVIIDSRHVSAVTACAEAEARNFNRGPNSLKFPRAINTTSAPSSSSPEPRDVPCTEHEIDKFEDRGRARELERTVTLDWVACSSEGFPGDELASAPTREGLIAKLVEKHECTRKYLKAKLMNGDIFTRRRITVSAWAHDETAEPSLDWVGNRPECMCELATACPEHGATTSRSSAWAKCGKCGASATCIGSYDGDPWDFACSECCGHSGEDGQCVPMDPDAVLMLLNRMAARAAPKILWVREEKFEHVLTADQPEIRVDSPSPTRIAHGDEIGIRSHDSTNTRTVMVRVVAVVFRPPHTTLKLERIEVRNG
jgi:hypothetical protein